MTEWLYFFNHAHEEVNETMREHYTNPAIQKAFGVLTTLSADEVRSLQSANQAEAS